MNIAKRIAREQYRSRVNKAAAGTRKMELPKKGWLSTTRKALGMSAAQLARRLGVTRAHVSNTEKAELSGGVTIKTMRNMAEAMGCRFVYAVVPKETVEDIVLKRAEKKARHIVEEASKQGALEDQALSDRQIKYEIKRLQKDMLEDTPSDFWNDED